MTNDSIKLGISSCLLGENVRYDGGHKLDRYLTDTLGPFVEWVSVCPEVECGLPTPRESMHLVGRPENPRLVTTKTGRDLTDRMQQWIAGRLDELEQENLCGFVFKTKSPSSGMRDVKIYNEKGSPAGKGAGLFAQAFMQRFPIIPVEDEGRLCDAKIRENFIERVFIYYRWLRFVNNNPTAKGFVDFHTDNKYLIMAHSPKVLTELGQITAKAHTILNSDILKIYITILMDCLKLLATVKKQVNVMHHIMGYFKKELTADEKQELLQVIEQYHNGLVPVIVPIVLLKHYTRKYNKSYLQRQTFLNPHPDELMLRNHV